MYKQQSYDTTTEKFFQPSEPFFGKSEKMTPEEIATKIATTFFKHSLRRYNFLTARGKTSIGKYDYGKLYNNINDALVHTFENFVIHENFKEAIKPNTDVNDFYRYTDGKNDNSVNVNGINITIKRGWMLENFGHLKLAFGNDNHFDDTQVNVHVHCEINDKNESIFIKNIENFINNEKNSLRYREITFEKYKEEKPKEKPKEKLKE